MNLPNFWYASCSYGVLWENYILYAGKILVWQNFGPFKAKIWPFLAIIVYLKLKTNIFAYSIGQLFLNCPAGQLRFSFIWRSSNFYCRQFRFPQITQPKAVCCTLYTYTNTHFELLLFRIFWTTSNLLLGIRSMKHALDLLSNYRVRQNISH